MPIDTTSADYVGAVIDKFVRRTAKRKSGCIEWMAGRDKDGYGNIRFRSATVRAHRLSYEFFVGPIHHEMLICHRCDNPCCVNPCHLFSGSQKDNIADSMTKGRFRLTQSKKYGVADSTICKIAKRRAWRHLP
jgi:hypothetical protein